MPLSLVSVVQVPAQRNLGEIRKTDRVDSVEIDAVGIRECFERHGDYMAFRTSICDSMYFAQFDIIVPVEHQRVHGVNTFDSDHVKIFGRSDVFGQSKRSTQFGRDTAVTAELFRVVADDHKVGRRDVEVLESICVSEEGAVSDDDVKRDRGSVRLQPFGNDIFPDVFSSVIVKTNAVAEYLEPVRVLADGVFDVVDGYEIEGRVTARRDEILKVSLADIEVDICQYIEEQKDTYQDRESDY